LGLWRISLESEFTLIIAVLHVVPPALVRPRIVCGRNFAAPPLLQRSRGGPNYEQAHADIKSWLDVTNPSKAREWRASGKG